MLLIVATRAWLHVAALHLKSMFQLHLLINLLFWHKAIQVSYTNMSIDWNKEVNWTEYWKNIEVVVAFIFP